MNLLACIILFVMGMLAGSTLGIFVTLIILDKESFRDDKFHQSKYK